jgi:hypothetical protein
MPCICRQRRSTAGVESKGAVGSPVLLALAAGVAAFFWWKRKQSAASGQNAKSQGGRSPFKFPAGRAKSPATASASQTAASSLPRSKASNNKKNKARRREEKAKRAEKRDDPPAKATAGAGSGGGGGAGAEQASSAVINYTYFDSARRDTILPTHNRPKLTAGDIMESEKEAQKKAQG